MPGPSFLSGTRVVHLLGGTASGGAENQCLYLLEALRGRGLELELAYFRQGSEHERFAALGLPMHQVASRGGMPRDWHRRALALRDCLDAAPPSILHTWLFEAHEVGLLAALQWPGTRVILAHRSGPGVPGTRRHLLALRPLRRRIDHVVANSSGGAKMMLGIGLEAHRVSIIPNGLPTDRVRLGQSRASVRRDLGIGPDTPLMCAVSRPDPSKDFPTLFAALARVRSVNPNGILILVGPTADHLRKLGSALPPGALAIGFHPRPPEVMNASDVVVIASRTEGHSNVADEALMLGLPVATTDTGGHPALVAQSGGRVVPVGRGDLLGAAILKLLEAPPDRADVRAVAARRLDMTRVADATTALYGRVLAAPRPHPEMRSPAE